MVIDEDFILSKSEEVKSHNFIKTVLELSGYNVMKFGIENHNQDILKKIRSNYSTETNRRLMSMPDFVVVDPESNEAFIIEVKHRNIKEDFSMKDTELIFKYNNIKGYLDFWEDATLILTFNVKPYCICLDFSKINWNNHFKGKVMGKNNNLDELWNFSGCYQLINDKFPKVTHESFNKALDLLK
jgi:hypothetical protein